MPFRGQLWPRFLAPAHHGPVEVRATVGALAVEAPQIQFLDDEMEGCWWAWYLVRQWIHGLRQLLGAFGWFLHIFYVMVFSDPEVAPVHNRRFSCFPELATFGIWTPRSRVPSTWQSLVRCCCVLFVVQCLVQQWIHVMRQLPVLLEGTLLELSSRILRSILVLLSWSLVF